MQSSIVELYSACAARTVAALTAACCLLSAGCSPSSTSEAAPPTHSAAPLVMTQVVSEQSWAEVVELTAEAVPWAAVTVAAETAGRVIRLPIEHGDRIGAGTLLAQLEAAGAEAELDQAEARLAASEANRSQAERDLRRGRSLAETRGILSNDDLERLALEFATSEANLLEATAAVRVAKERLADLRISAPFGGVVSERLVELGSWVSPGSPIVRLVDRDRIKIRAAVAATERVRLSLGAVARVSAEAFPGSSFEAKLRFLGEEADPATGTFLVEAEISSSAMAEAGHQLLPGMLGTLEIELARHSGLLVPRTAVLETTAGASLFVVSQGAAQQRSIEAQPATPGNLRINQGLQAGEVIVVQGQNRLADGQTVEVRQP